MTDSALIADIARSMGEPARVAILGALQAAPERSAGELTEIAGLAPSTVSEHLGKLVTTGLITVRADGRKRLYRLADPEVGALLGTIRALAQTLGRA